MRVLNRAVKLEGLYNYSYLLFFLCAGLFCIYFGFETLYGEKIIVNDGMGYDGIIYAGFAKSYFSNLIDHEVNPYYFQRLLPSVMVHAFAKLFHINLDNNVTLVRTFCLYNLSLIVVGGYLFFRVGKLLSWSMQVCFSCLALLILNFFNLKLAVYYPVLTDTSAFFIGILSIYFYVRSNTLGLLLSIAMGAFVFPDMLYVMAPLFIFPYCEKINKTMHQRNYLIPGLITTILGIWLMYCAGSSIIHNLFPLSLVALLLYLFFASRFLIYFKTIFASTVKQVRLINVFLYISLTIAVKFIIHTYSSNGVSPITTQAFLSWFSSNSLIYPMTSIVSHFMYFGAGVILLFLLWPQITLEAYEFGIGCVGFIFIYLLLSLDSESRQLVNAWPMFVVLIGSTLNKYKISWTFTGAITLLNLIISRCWLTINVGPWTSSEFPAQLYFMNFGPWLSLRMYIVFAMLGIIVLLTLIYMLKLELRAIPKYETAGVCA